MIGLLKICLVLTSLCITIVPSIEDKIIFTEPPRINSTYSETIVTSGRNLTLTCSGKKELTWTFPENTETESAEQSERIVSVTDIPDENYPFGLMLEIIGIMPSDVGFYTCVYNTTDNLEADREDVVNDGQASSVYVFVDDPDTLMVPVPMVVTGKQYHNATFPCRPTAPNVNVDLYINEGENVLKVIVGKEIDMLGGRKISFDRRIGFTLPELEMNDPTLSYNCIFDRDGKNSSLPQLITIIPFTSSVTKPMITDAFNGNTVIGGEIHLECNVRIDAGIQFTLRWRRPNLDIEPERLNISSTKVGKHTGKNNSEQRVGTSTLTITGVKKEDQGIYKCQVIDANGNTNFAEKNITVRNVGESFINLTEGANKYKVTVRAGKFAKWMIQVNAFPPPNITWFDNRNNRVMSPWVEPHVAKAEVMIPPGNPKETWIYIQDSQLSDAGTYRVQATNQFETQELNLTLVVTDAPKVNLTSQNYHLINNNAMVYCSIKAHPVSRVNWYFQDCLKIEDCVGLPKEEISKEQYRVKQVGYNVESTLITEANRSGHVTCVGKNSLGADSKSVPFYVSEVHEGFGIVGDWGNIAEGDNVTITCVASLYKDIVSLLWYKNGSAMPLTNDTTNGYTLIPEVTKYSQKLSLWIPRANNSHNGLYYCRAQTKSGDSTDDEVKEQYITVEDIVKPTIRASWNLTELHLHLGVQNKLFDCSAEGIPVPEIKWYKDNAELDSGNNENRVHIQNHVGNGRSLKFNYIKEEDHGTYTCRAFSRVGSISKNFKIIIANSEFKVGYIATIVGLIILFIVLVSFLIWKIRKEKQIRKELSLAGLLHFEEGDTQCLNPELGVDEQADLLPYDKKWEFPREKLKLGPQLGSGAFGVVMKAKACGIVEGEETTTVAVKMVKKTADTSFIKALASELKIMVHLGKHLNVVNLLGACTNNVAKRELLVIVEYCRFGNIHNYLLRHRANFIDQVVRSTDTIDITIGAEHVNRAYSVSSNRSGTGKEDTGDSALGSGGLQSANVDTNNTVISMVPASGDVDGIISNGSAQPEWRSNYRGDYNYSKEGVAITTQELICWAFQVARGMEYLANRKVLHGDLAARNILLADNNIVKICDFGLAKNMYKNDNYKKKGDGPLPVKWMAVESIRDRVFSTQSDVWSYGIVLWELFSLAKTPYPGMDANEDFYNRLNEGYRMEKPEYANKHIYQLMIECWRAQPVQRPTFGELAERLGNLLEDGVRNHYIDLNSPYLDMNAKWQAERGDNDYLAMMSAPDYGNLVSANKHEYVNDPFGGPTRVNPLSPDDTDDEGYLRMIPNKNGVVSREAPIFNFNAPVPRKNSLNNTESETEMVPMLDISGENQRLNSVSDISESYPTSPTTPKSPDTINIINSFSNPTYQPMFKLTQPIKEESVEEDTISDDNNYVKMSQKDSGFIDSMDVNVNIPPSYTNPSYVTMTGNKQAINPLYNNILPPTTVISTQ